MNFMVHLTVAVLLGSELWWLLVLLVVRLIELKVNWRNYYFHYLFCESNQINLKRQALTLKL